ncbi:MAG: hypothetical protein WC373_12615 [Smithella sp.]|jgi:hypothetical protein
MEYNEFLHNKTHSANKYGFEPTVINKNLFPFQEHLLRWSTIAGRSALFEDCGLGKTIQYLCWADNVVRQTNGNILILTPLAVSEQTIREGEKFGIECQQSRDGKFTYNIVVTNYEKLHLFDRNDFVGVICDESSILKNYEGTRKQQITDFVRKIPYRLLCTATAAPNDYIELGTSSEALGIMGHMDMLNRFFKNDQNTSDTKRHWESSGGGAPKWRFKKHAENVFWRWVASWAMAIRKPSDIGFDDNGFILPKLIENQYDVDATRDHSGFLFPQEAIGLKEQREEARATIEKRCEKVSELVDHDRPCVVWCHLNDEGKLLNKMIPGSVEVFGGQSDEKKEELLNGFSNNHFRVLITKPKIAGFGLNWQHCADMCFFPSHSYEQYYQCVRRSYRFGQKNDVNVNIVTTQGMKSVLENLKRKSVSADKMFSLLVQYMSDSIKIDMTEKHFKKTEVPKWLDKPAKGIV